MLLQDNTLFCEPSQSFNFFFSRLFGSPLPFINSDTLKGMRSLNACIGANFVGGENLYEEREKPETGCISDQRGSVSSDDSFRFCVPFEKLDSPETSRLSEIRQPQEQPGNSEYTTTVEVANGLGEAQRLVGESEPSLVSRGWSIEAPSNVSGNEYV